MMRKIPLTIFLFFAFCLLFFAPPVWAGRPLVTNDAYVTETGRSQFESATPYYKYRDESNFLNMVTTSRYGLLPHLEMAGDLIFAFWNRGQVGQSGLSDVKLKAKYAFNEGAENQPLWALGLAYKPATGDFEKGLGSGTHDGFINLIATQKLRKITAHANAGFGWVMQGAGGSFWSAALAGEFPLFKKNTGFLELTARFPVDSAEKVINFGMGINQTLAENVVTDTAIAFGLTNGAPKYVITSGWTFSI